MVSFKSKNKGGRQVRNIFKREENRLLKKIRQLKERGAEEKELQELKKELLELQRKFSSNSNHSSKNSSEIGKDLEKKLFTLTSSGKKNLSGKEVSDIASTINEHIESWNQKNIFKIFNELKNFQLEFNVLFPNVSQKTKILSLLSSKIKEFEQPQYFTDFLRNLGQLGIVVNDLSVEIPKDELLKIIAKKSLTYIDNISGKYLISMLKSFCLLRIDINELFSQEEKQQFTLHLQQNINQTIQSKHFQTGEQSYLEMIARSHYALDGELLEDGFLLKIEEYLNKFDVVKKCSKDHQQFNNLLKNNNIEYHFEYPLFHPNNENLDREKISAFVVDTVFEKNGKIYLVEIDGPHHFSQSNGDVTNDTYVRNQGLRYLAKLHQANFVTIPYTALHKEHNLDELLELYNANDHNISIQEKPSKWQDRESGRGQSEDMEII